MFIRSLAIIALAAPAAAFAPSPALRTTTSLAESALGSDITAETIRKDLNYKPGQADTEFARRYKHLVGAKVKTVGEAFTEFTKDLGSSVNPLYKSMVTDLVGTTHLIVVNARFQKDAVWCLGILTTTDLLLKNYPEPEIGAKIVSSLFKSVGLDEAEIRAEAASVKSWVAGKSKEDIEAALSGEGDSPIAKAAKQASEDEFWFYSRYFGIGLVSIMDEIGMEMDKDTTYPIMEDWMTNKMGKSHLTACNDSDLFFRIKDKLDMMETMMKEIEIREKKRMAERLEEKAEAALRAADREVKMQKEIEAEAEKSRELAGKTD